MNTMTVTLTGSGPVQLSTGGGILHHGDLGPAFADGTDFDSSQPGDQTVPDASGWTVNVTGGGSDTLEIDEGEATDPVSYNFGHTFFPGGTPCAVRAPQAQQAIQLSPDPAQETWFCYPSGIAKVIVRPGGGSIQYGVLDTQAGVPLYLYGGAGGNDVMSEGADVPTEVGGYHNAASPVYFYGGSGPATVSLIDDQGSSPATYTIGNGEIVKSGLYPLYYSLPDDQASSIGLYPQSRPSTINVGHTSGITVQIFGGFFGQTGPDVINGADADAPMLVEGSLGHDTITTSPIAGGSYVDDGGDPTIYATNNPGTYIDCNQSGKATGTVYAVKADSIHNCSAVHYQNRPLVLSHIRFKSSRVRHGSNLTLELPVAITGRLTLTYARQECKSHHRSCHYANTGTRTITVHAGTTKLMFSSKATAGRNARLGSLAPGTYRVAIQLSSGGQRSNTVKLALTIT
jgi:hypothetical protein